MAGQKRKKIYKGVALRTQTAYICGKEYKFKKGEKYEVDNEEAWAKLTNSIMPVLRGV